MHQVLVYHEKKQIQILLASECIYVAADCLQVIASVKYHNCWQDNIKIVIQCNKKTSTCAKIISKEVFEYTNLI